MLVAPIYSINIEIGFKGNRNYIQGPDLVNCVLNHFSGSIIEKIKFSSHGFVNSTSCTLSVYDKEPGNSHEEFRGALTVDSINYWVKITGDEQTVTENRQSYNEDLVTAACERNGKTIHFSGNSPYTLVETCVSMKKYLLMQLVPPSDKKWIFTAIEMDKYQDYRSNLSIEVTHNFQNKLVKSKILYNSDQIGIIYFSMVSP